MKQGYTRAVYEIPVRAHTNIAVAAKEARIPANQIITEVGMHIDDVMRLLTDKRTTPTPDTDPNRAGEGAGSADR